MMTAKLSRDLTPAELDALKLSASGWRICEIAERLNTSAGAVAQMRREYREKLNAKTPEHAVALAFCYGIIKAKDIDIL